MSCHLGLFQGIEDWQGQLPCSEYQMSPNDGDPDVDMDGERFVGMLLDLGEGTTPRVHREAFNIGHPMARVWVKF